MCIVTDAVRCVNFTSTCGTLRPHIGNCTNYYYTIIINSRVKLERGMTIIMITIIIMYVLNQETWGGEPLIGVLIRAFRAGNISTIFGPA